MRGDAWPVVPTQLGKGAWLLVPRARHGPWRRGWDSVPVVSFPRLWFCCVAAAIMLLPPKNIRDGSWSRLLNSPARGLSGGELIGTSVSAQGKSRAGEERRLLHKRSYPVCAKHAVRAWHVSGLPGFCDSSWPGRWERQKALPRKKSASPRRPKCKGKAAVTQTMLIFGTFFVLPLLL